MGSFGGIEWLVIILVVLLLFGAKKIPELARGLGQGLTEFRKASTDIRKEIEKGSEEPTMSEKDQNKRKTQETAKSQETAASQETAKSQETAPKEETAKSEDKSNN